MSRFEIKLVKLIKKTFNLKYEKDTHEKNVHFDGI